MSTPAPRKDREWELARIRRRLEKLHSPRLQMALIVALTGAVGFLTSVLLLHAGVDSLWLRYPLAVVVAYLAFLLLLCCWLRSRGDEVLDHLDPSGLAPHPDFLDQGGVSTAQGTPGGGEFGGGGASGSWGDAAGTDALSTGPSVPDFSAPDLGDAWEPEGLPLVVVVVLLVVLAAAVSAAFWLVWAAPVLLAELLLDVALASGLYRRLRGVRGQHWLSTAVKRTWWLFAIAAAAFALAGAVMGACVPSANSIGDVLRYSEPAR